jgi:nucleoside-triphosphatase THEP1
MGWNWKGESSVHGFNGSPDSLLASLSINIDSEENRLVFITGSIGSGKTSWCMELAHSARDSGISFEGLVSPAVVIEDHKVGIDLRDLQSGEQRRLAILRTGKDRIPDDIEWKFDDDTFAWGNRILEKLVGYPFIILDELGPLELKQGKGFTNGIELVSARRYRLACVVVRPSLLQVVRAIFPWGQERYVHFNPSAEVS